MSAYGSPGAAAFDLLRHVPPKDIEARLFDVLVLNEELADELLSTVDIPLKIAQDEETSMPFIQCDYNRDGDSYRSPFSNKYYPPIDDGQMISSKLRNIETIANKGFGAYVKLYFGEAIFSVYCFEIDEHSFGLGVFIRKETSGDTNSGDHRYKGNINCSDVFTITNTGSGQHEYSLVSSALLHLELENDQLEPIVLSGGCSSQVTKTMAARNDIEHVINAGTMIEENGTDFMRKIQTHYVGKMTEILGFTKMVGLNDDPRKMMAQAMMSRNSK